MDFVDLIVAVHEHLSAAKVRHAFGGALALAYVAEPRGTVDIDVNVFGVTLEGMFSIAPSDGWSFLAGPVFDLGFVGSAGEDSDYTEMLFGLMFGIEGHVTL